VKNTKTSTPQFETPAHLAFHKSKPALIKTLFEPQGNYWTAIPNHLGARTSIEH